MRVEEPTDPAKVVVNSSLLLYLGKGEPTHFEILTARRRDRLAKIGERWKIESRWGYLSQTKLSSSLSVFL